MTCIVSVWWVASRIVGVTPAEEHAYPVDAVKELCSQQMNAVLGSDVKYEHGACKDWAAQILANMVSGLNKLEKPFKYIVSCQMLQLQPVTGQEFPPYGEWASRLSGGAGDDDDDDDASASAAKAVKPVAPTEGMYGKIGASGTGFYSACSAIWDGQADQSLTYSRDVTSHGCLRCRIGVHGLYDSDSAHRPS